MSYTCCGIRDRIFIILNVLEYSDRGDIMTDLFGQYGVHFLYYQSFSEQKYSPHTNSRGIDYYTDQY